MKTLTLKTTIAKDRKLTIALPDDVIPGPVEVVVIVNPLPRGIDLTERGWTEADAAEARARLRSFDDDWNAPGMEAYDAL